MQVFLFSLPVPFYSFNERLFLLTGFPLRLCENGLGHAKACPGKLNHVWVVMNLSTIVMSMDK